MGILTAPEEDSRVQINRLEKQAKQWANLMVIQILSMRDIMESYGCQLLPRLVYPMVTLNSTAKQLEGVMRQAMGKVKHSHYLARTMATDKMYLPTMFGGTE